MASSSRDERLPRRRARGPTDGGRGSKAIAGFLTRFTRPGSPPKTDWPARPPVAHLLACLLLVAHVGLAVLALAYQHHCKPRHLRRLRAPALRQRTRAHCTRGRLPRPSVGARLRPVGSRQWRGRAGTRLHCCGSPWATPTTRLPHSHIHVCMQKALCRCDGGITHATHLAVLGLEFRHLRLELLPDLLRNGLAINQLCVRAQVHS